MMPESWPDQRSLLELMACGKFYAGVIAEVDRAAIRAALERLDALEAVADMLIADRACVPDAPAELASHADVDIEGGPV